MKVISIRIFAICLAAGICSHQNSCAQEVRIQRVELDDGKISIHYDLLDDNSAHRYTLRLYSSIDNYTQPLEYVEGDINSDIPVGANKQLSWDVEKELGSGFAGELKLEIKGQLYIPFIELNTFEGYKYFRRGNPYHLTWSGGRGDNVLNFDLYNPDNELKYSFPNIANVGEYELTFPLEIKPGKDYRFRISDSRNQDEFVFTNTFVIKRKIPLGLKLGGGIAVAVLTKLIIDLLTEPDLVDPPNPPNRN